MGLDEVRAMSARMRSGTNQPFNLNFFIYDAPKSDASTLGRTKERMLPWYKALGLGEPPSTLPDRGPGFDAAKLALVLELRPPVVSFHFGVPDAHMIEALKKAGIILINSASTVAEARTLAASGFDAIIAQGWEAGGHRGSHKPTAPMDGVGTFALVPQIVDAVKVPVIAAGGVGDGRGIAAAFALGASGVQIGTGFLGCPEAGTDRARRALLRRATDTDTIVTDAISGRSARAVRSRYALEMEQSRERLPAYPSMYAFSDPIIKAAADSEASFHLYGQSAALTQEMPADQLMERLVSESAAVFARLAGGDPGD
jgi:nitronate monooxygenase